MSEYVVVKWLHVLSSTILFGTGIGTAFYLFVASRSRDARIAHFVARKVVVADWVFTGTSAIVQPVTGLYLVHVAGYQILSPWIAWSIALFLVAGACWLPVVWLQKQMRDMAAAAAEVNAELPDRYWRYFRIWAALGVPAFASLLVVFYLMVAKPT